MSKQILGNLKKGLLFVISAPAGTGKSTLVRMLIEEFPDYVVESCSATTRHPRAGEIDERHYDFLTGSEFETLIKADAFLEYAEVFGNYYGTKKEEVERLQNEKKHVFLVIDTQGAMQLKEKIDAVFIFITPPNFEELKRRLLRRKTEDVHAIEKRLSFAEKELLCAKHYDYQLINDNLDITYQILRSILIAEEHKALSKQLEGSIINL